MKHKILMIPGPTEVSSEVLAKLALPIEPHYGDEFVKLYFKVVAKLKKIFETSNNIFILAATCSAAMETAVNCAVEQEDKVLVCLNGFFGERFKEIVESVGAIPVLVEADIGKPIEPNVVKRVLDDNHEIRTLTVVHNESSTGVENPIEEICEVASRRRVLTIVDSVSGLGGTRLSVNKWKIDLALSGSQKCIGAPTGLSFLTISQKAWERFRNRKTQIHGWYLNLLNLKRYQDQWRNWHPQGPNSAPVSLYMALDAALDDVISEGMETRIKRHEKVTRALRCALKEVGLEALVEDRFASKTVTAVKLPSGVDGEELRKMVADDFDILLTGGVGETKNSIIRIGHMGMTAQSKYLLPTLKAIELTLSKLGFAIEKNKAQEVFKTIMAEGNEKTIRC